MRLAEAADPYARIDGCGLSRGMSQHEVPINSARGILAVQLAPHILGVQLAPHILAV